jgi:hypothetical protein
MYDIIIVGGGIAGIYCAEQLSKDNSILLLESNSYFGGRLYTVDTIDHKNHIHYEAGAGRFNNNHVLLNSLIKKYKLTPNPIPSRINYLEKEDAYDYYLKTMSKLIKVKMTRDLYSLSFYQYCKNTLSLKEAKLLVNIFGYYSEFKTMNAYDAISSFKHDFIKQSYYNLKEGFSELCNRMINSSKVKVLLSTPVISLEKHDELYHVNGYICKKVIIAIPPQFLQKFPLLKPILPLLKGIQSCSLLRIYATYNPIWFKGMIRTTSSSIIRQIIPINQETGLVMFYFDGRDIYPYLNTNHTKLKSDLVIQNILEKELYKLFPDKIINKPIYFKCHYWEIGTHALKPKYTDHRPKLINPMKNIYLCGEAYSYKHGWIEGALETANKVINKINNNI